MADENRPPTTDELREFFRSELIASDAHLSVFGRAWELVDRYRFYLETLENFISASETDEVGALKAQAAELPERHREEFWQWQYPIHWDEVFRTTLRSSFIVSLISFIETRLAQACGHVEVIARTPISCGTLKGSTFERARIFLDAFGGFVRPTPEQWARVERLYDIRNVFVHHAGFIGTYSHHKRLEQFISQQPGIGTEHNHIAVEPEFCRFVLKTAEEFVGAVESELVALCARARRFDRR